jgi:uncharacterized protein (DUF1778 family)
MPAQKSHFSLDPGSVDNAPNVCVQCTHDIDQPMKTETQNERIQLRASEGEKRLLQQAADTAKKTLSEFILNASITEAEIALSQRTRFILDSDRWQQFIETLERPVTSKPALKKLLRRPSALER